MNISKCIFTYIIRFNQFLMGLIDLNMIYTSFTVVIVYLYVFTL